MTFTPSVVTTCPNYSTGCVEQVNLHKPSGDETVYQLTLINGAWNTGATVYTGSAASGQKLSSSTSTNQYANGCTTTVACFNGNYISQSLQTTTLYPNGSQAPTQALYAQTQSFYNLYVGKISDVKEWDYVTTSPSTTTPPTTTPTRETTYTYTGNDPYQVTVLDSSGNQAGLTTYGYTTVAAVAPGTTQQGVSTGPYLHTVSHWLNAGGTPASTTTYTMDNSGMMTGVQDPNLNPASTISYQCSHSLPYQVSNTVNQTTQTTQYGYDCASGAITSVQNPNDVATGRSTAYTYEPTAGRPHTVTLPDNGVTTYTYPSATEVDTSVNAAPNPTVSSAAISDTFGRPYESITGGIEVDRTYDVNGRPYCTTNPYSQGGTSSGSTCITVYDGLDRPVTQQQPDSTTLGWTYSGNTTYASNELGFTWTRSVDAFGHLTSVIEPGPSGSLTTTYSYDGLGNAININQAGNTANHEAARQRTFTYDSASRLICASHPESSSLNTNCPTSATTPIPQGVTGYTYDPAGNLKTKTDARNITITYGYDTLNRLISKTYSANAATASACYQYDQSALVSTGGNLIGRLTNMWTQSGACPAAPTSFASPSILTRRSVLAYDPVGRVQTEQQCTRSNCAAGAPYTPTYDYDLAGNVVHRTNGVAAVPMTFTNGYDNAGRLSGITSSVTQYPTSLFSASSSTSTPGYSPAGGLMNATFGSGLSLSRTYDSRLRVTGETDIGNSVQGPTPGSAAITIQGTDQSH